jgi:N12 class adenine-specific DNA methylase
VIASRQQLNQTYDSFVAKFGPISEPVNAGAFRSDPDLPLLLSLERYDPETHRASKAAIFRERTVQRNPPCPEVSTAKDALLVTLNARGMVDMPFLANLLHRPQSEFLPELTGAIFLNPQTNRWETDDDYLSGNVRLKLAAAESAALVDKQFEPNVEALKAVQPDDLSASEIDARLGSTWVTDHAHALAL